MKKLLLAAALAAFVTSPAAAQYRGLAASPGYHVVVADGRIIGQDPDPNVRLQLRRTALTAEDTY